MAINLQKGGRFNLTKKEPGLKKVMIGLGWEFKEGNQLDLDASVFLLNQNGKLVSDSHFIFYNNLKSPDGSVEHTGDNRSGAGEGDDEMVLFNMESLDNAVQEVLVVASIHDAAGRNHNFGLLEDAYIRVVDVENQREILRYDLDADAPLSTDMEFGKFKRNNGEWEFEALGIGSTKGLEGYVNVYG